MKLFISCLFIFTTFATPPIWEGDIAVRPGEIEHYYGKEVAEQFELFKQNIRGDVPNKPKRNLGIFDVTNQYWRGHYVNGKFQIPYKIGATNAADSSIGTNQMSSSDQTLVLQYMNELEVALGNVIEFVDKDANPDAVTNNNNAYVNIGDFTGTSGCWSYIGNIFEPQDMQLGTGCVNRKTVQHEALHFLGFFHEQSRPDRDTYVTVHFENILSGFESQFSKSTNIDSRTVPYDYSSIMHYSEDAFLDSTKGTKTMTVLDNTFTGELGGNFDSPVSTYDQLQTRMLYRCQNSIPSSWETNCVASCTCRLNEGKCTDDAGCDSGLICDKSTSTCQTTAYPSTSPSRAPTTSPTTKSPSSAPTVSPTTKQPSSAPSASPTGTPSKTPTTSEPTHSPVGFGEPTKSPTKFPTISPSKVPSKSPTKPPTSSPTKSPTASPTAPPTESSSPSITVIAGAAVGGAAVVTALGYGAYNVFFRSPVSSTIGYGGFPRRGPRQPRQRRRRRRRGRRR